MSNSKKTDKNINKNRKPAGGQTETANLLTMSQAPRLGAERPWWYMVPIAVFMALTVLIVRLMVVTRDTSEYAWLAGTGEEIYDFFAYAKMCLIIITGIAVVLVLIYMAVAKSLYIRKTAIYAPMAIYGVLVAVSYACSEHKDFASFGYIDRYEGTFVILAYLVLLFYIINAVNGEGNVRLVMRCFTAALTILSLLGLTQMTGHDFFQSGLGKALIVPSKLAELRESLNFTFENNEVYQTVFNTNYVSFYMALVIPVMAMLFVQVFNHAFSMEVRDEEDKKLKIRAVVKAAAFLALLVLLVLNLAGSKAIGGFMGLGIGLIVTLALLNRRILKWWKPMICVALAIAVPLGCTTSYWLGQVADQVGQAAVSTAVVAEAATIENTDGMTPCTTAPYLDYIETGDDYVEMGINGNPLRFQFTETDDSSGLENLTGLKLYDEDGNDVAHSANADLTAQRINSKLSEGASSDEIGDDSVVYQVNDDRFFDYLTYSFGPDGYGINYLYVVTYDHTWTFMTMGGCYYENGYDIGVSLEKVDAIGFEDNQEFGSGRGYIWSRSIPLMKDTILKGYGADTYALYFPQQDYAGKYNCTTYRNQLDIIVDKPHNMYIGMWIGTGGLSCLMFLIMMLIYIAGSVKAYRGCRYESYMEYVGAGIFIGVCGFLVSALVNDSNVSVMPMFYGLLGTGIAINLMIVGKRKAEARPDTK